MDSQYRYGIPLKHLSQVTRISHIRQVVLELELDELIVQLSEEGPEALETQVALLVGAEEGHQ